MSRPTQFTIDLQALCENATTLKRLAGTRSTMAVVKADAYGHGAAKCAATLSPLVDAFAVAIGKNSLIGSNAVVTKDVPEKSIMAGIPATKVGDATKGFKPYAVTDEDKK